MLEAWDGVKEVIVGRELLKDVKFADDRGMVAQSENGLEK